jgi:predicted dehydrogenase
MKDRREFLKKSLGGLVLGMTGNMQAMNSYGDRINRVSTDRANDYSDITGGPAKGKSVMGLRCEPVPRVRAAIIGCGRGISHCKALANIEGAHVVVLCDLFQERIDNLQDVLKKSGRPKAESFTGEEDYRKICERDDIDLIINSTNWEMHVPIALYAMKHGKHVAVEVPAALTPEDCWALVDTAEETQRHCMMLENCCYDFFELNTLNMARKGLFGEIYHGEGAYYHCLSSIADLRYASVPGWKNWRGDFNRLHDGNPYPTHGLGPVAQIMGINRGDRFDYLTSMSSNQYGLTLVLEDKFGKDSPEARTPFKKGDVNITLIRTVKGHTFLIGHDITSPRPYDRIHKIVGTKGMAVKYPNENVAIPPNPHEFLSPEKLQVVMQEYQHPLTKYIGEKARAVGGHGGMDYTMIWRLVYCLQKGLPLDQDVYDAAAWSCLVELSERSVDNRSAAVDIPDFTRGAWKTAKPWPVIDMKRIFY